MVFADDACATPHRTRRSPKTSALHSPAPPQSPASLSRHASSKRCERTRSNTRLNFPARSQRRCRSAIDLDDPSARRKRRFPHSVTASRPTSPPLRRHQRKCDALPRRCKHPHPQRCARRSAPAGFSSAAASDPRSFHPLRCSVPPSLILLAFFQFDVLISFLSNSFSYGFSRNKTATCVLHLLLGFTRLASPFNIHHPCLSGTNPCQTMISGHFCLVLRMEANST